MSPPKNKQHTSKTGAPRSGGRSGAKSGERPNRKPTGKSASRPATKSTSRPTRKPATSSSRPTGKRAGPHSKSANSRNNYSSRNTYSNSKAKNTAQHKMGGEQIEGRRAVLELLVAGTRRTKEIFMAADLNPAPILTDIEMIAEAEQVPIHKVPKAKLFEMAHTDAPQGIVANAAPLKPTELEDLAAINKKPFILVLDGVLDTLNLGNLLRSAECAGVTGVVIGKHRSARITPAAAKAAAGAIEYLPIALVPGIPATIDRLKELGIWTLGLDSTAPLKIYDINFASEAIALVIGAEGSGLKKLTKARVDELAAIPIKGRIEALNAAAASAVACFEIQRLRG